MKLMHIITLLVAVGILGGCATQRTVLCITPSGEFQPETGAELLQEFNRQMPFAVSPRQFMCKHKSGRLVGWLVVKTERQKDIAKQSLRESSRLNCGQVEALTPEMVKVIRAHWRESQDVKAPNKKHCCPESG
jgi:hypothetical protein